MNSYRSAFTNVTNTMLNSRQKSKQLKTYISMYSQNREHFIPTLKNTIYKILTKHMFTPNIRNSLKLFSKIICKFKHTRYPEDQQKADITEILIYFGKMLFCSREKLRIGALFFLNKLQINGGLILGKIQKDIAIALENLIYDKSSKVRGYAVELAGSLQLWKLLLDSMDIDPFYNVRMKCVRILPQNLLMNSRFINRLRDLAKEIRIFVLGRLETFGIENFTQQALLSFLQICNFDKEEEVKQKAISMFYKGIDRNGYKYFCTNIGYREEFLTRLFQVKLLVNESETEKLHETLCSSLETADENDIYLLRLSSEAMRKFNRDIMIPLESLIKIIYKLEEHYFSLNNALLILRFYDFSIPEIRHQLYNVIKNVVNSINITDLSMQLELEAIVEYDYPEIVIENIVKIIKSVFASQENEFSRLLKELIDEAYEGADDSKKKIQEKYDKRVNSQEVLKREIGLLKCDSTIDENEKLIKLEELECVFVKQETKLKKESLTVYAQKLKALLICLYALKYSSIGVLKEEFIGIDAMILTNLEFEIKSIKTLAINCLGYYCLLSSTQAKIHIPRLIIEIENKSELEGICIKFIFDILCTFDLLNEFELVKSAILLSKYLSAQSTPFLETAVLGFCKLIMLEKLKNSPGIIVKFIIIYNTNNLDLSIEEILQTFFVQYYNSPKTTAKFVKALKIYLALKRYEKKASIPFFISGKNLNKLLSLCSAQPVGLKFKENYHFSLLMLLSSLYIRGDLPKKIFEEIITDLNWKSFTKRDLAIVQYFFRMNDVHKSQVPKIIIKVLEENKVVVEDYVESDGQKENVRIVKADNEAARFFRFINNKADVYVFMSNEIESIFLNGAFPNKRPRQE